MERYFGKMIIHRGMLLGIPFREPYLSRTGDVQVRPRRSGRTHEAIREYRRRTHSRYLSIKYKL